ncbi:MAG: hypothetical protein VX727_09495 [Planctomycetota bacterium]|nr:hypothetical protein [Planctomycetota bacterium]
MSDGMSPATFVEGPDETPTRSVIPSVLGVMGIIWASFGLLCNFSAFSNGQFDIPWSYTITDFGLTLLMSLWLLWASINLLRRKRSSRGGLLSWSVIWIIVTLVLTVWGTQFIDQTVDMVVAQEQEAMVGDESAPQISEEDLRSFIAIGVYAIIGINLVINLLWPAVLLIFLNTPGMRQDMDTWEAGGAEVYGHDA